ncbi:YgiQ family radical SAM protein [Gordonibacter pamelaeae]|uniref:YgiQ family radical SAM protein n=1 Tax=Gordonibacter pamelaeae TaxID=471189 RepID=UPI00267048EF|nr:YgiQ family radical SAM protein [Gordonibacter pamelaeae]
MSAQFLPVNRQDMAERGWDQVDFVYVSGDAYVDHPSFGAAIVTRLLESHGYKVGVIAQPDWNDPASVAALGEPRLAFLVSAGNMDSMVNHYTVARKRRREDAYSPGGQAGLRPNHAAVVYSNLIRRTFKKTPIVLGGIEASLRRLAHYDYWSDKMKRSILLDSGADLVSFGMGERSVVEIADALAAGLSIDDLTFIDGTVYRASSLAHVYDAVELPSFPDLQADPLNYARSFAVQYANSDPFTGKRLVEPYSDHEFVVQNPPAAPLSQAEMDAVYRLPFARTYHPMYEEAGGVPAIKEVRFSLTSSRGCFGECSFCALTFHQGRIVQARSHDSLVEEARAITDEPGFKGYIHDVGGPTANFRAPACAKQTKAGACPHQRCLFPEPCERLEADHVDYLKLLERLRKLPGVKKVFVRSGIRFDYVLADRKHGDEFIYELCENHVSGQLKVAPEHVSDTVLAHMGKPPRAVYERFVQKYEQANEELGKRQYLVPYLMSSHPGSTLDEAVELAEYVRDLGYMPEQVQDFYPTPSTISTVMYATGVDPRTMQPVYVPKSPHEKALQRALIQYRDPKNRPLVLEALKKAGRMDLVGHGRECLVRPEGAPPAKGPRGKASGSATLRKVASKADPARKGSGKGGGKGEGARKGGKGGGKGGPARKGNGKSAGRGEPTRKDGGKPSAKQPAGRDAADRSSRPSSPHKAAKGSPKRPGASSPKSGRAMGGRGPRRP